MSDETRNLVLNAVEVIAIGAFLAIFVWMFFLLVLNFKRSMDD